MQGSFYTRATSGSDRGDGLHVLEMRAVILLVASTSAPAELSTLIPDVWSLAATLIELATTCTSFEGDEEYDELSQPSMFFWTKGRTEDRGQSYDGLMTGNQAQK